MKISRIGILLLGLWVASVTEAAPQNFIARLNGDNEVPDRNTMARGLASFQFDGVGELSYRLNVANIDNVIAAHIHLGPAGVNGQVVAFLFGSAPAGQGRFDGVLAEGVITSVDLLGPFIGQDLSVLIEAIRTGGAYVNVHTNDGVGEVNTGPGDFPGGEIRGQILSSGRPE